MAVGDSQTLRKLLWKGKQSMSSVVAGVHSAALESSRDLKAALFSSDAPISAGGVASAAYRKTRLYAPIAALSISAQTPRGLAEQFARQTRVSVEAHD